jgi:hypothetical protein
VVKDAVDLVLVLPAIVKEDDGNDSHSNVEIVDPIDHFRIFDGVFVVARQVTVVISTAG